MGSFLVRCAVTQSALQEGQDIVLAFLTRPLTDHEGNCTASDFISEYGVEDVLIEAVQDDYGDVQIKPDQIPKALILMETFYNHCLDSKKENKDENWKHIVNSNWKSFDVLKQSDNSVLTEAFSQFVSMLHRPESLFKHYAQGCVVEMSVAHIDKVVFDEVKKAPAHMWSGLTDEKGIIGSSSVKNFEEYKTYSIEILKKECLDSLRRHQLALEKKKPPTDDQKMLDLFATMSLVENLSRHGKSLDSSDYYKLLREYDSVDRDNLLPIKEKIELELEKYKKENEDNMLVKYAKMVGVRFVPSVYAGQDYEDENGQAFRDLMRNVFAVQRVANIKKRYGYDDIDENLTEEDYVALRLQSPMEQQMEEKSALPPSLARVESETEISKETSKKMKP